MPRFFIVGYVWQILGRRGLFIPKPHPSSHPWATPKKPILNKVKKKRKMWETAEIPANIAFTHDFPQHIQILCLKNQHAKTQIVCLTTSFTIPLRKGKVKVSTAKISLIFSRNKYASTEPHNYPINLFFFCKWKCFSDL